MLAAVLPVADTPDGRLAALCEALAEWGETPASLGLPPHISLAVWPEDAAAPEAVAAIARRTPAFTVTLCALGVFRHAVAILPGIAPALWSLHRNVAATGQNLQPHYADESWVPHLTLVKAVKDPDGLRRALRAAESLLPALPVRVALTRLQLVRFRPAQIVADYGLAAADVSSVPRSTLPF